MGSFPQKYNDPFFLWPKWVCAAEQDMLFRVLNLKRGVQFHYLPSRTWCLFGSDAAKKV